MRRKFVGNQYIYQLISLVLLILLAIFAFYLPERKKKKQMQESIASLRRGDIVITKNGLKGRIQKVGADTVIVEVEASGTRLEIAKWGIAQVNPHGGGKK